MGFQPMRGGFAPVCRLDIFRKPEVKHGVCAKRFGVRRLDAALGIVNTTPPATNRALASKPGLEARATRLTAECLVWEVCDFFGDRGQHAP